MTWLVNLDSAVKTVMENKKHGVHIFFYESKNAFMVVRDSQNGVNAGDRIFKDYENYHGFIQDKRANKKEGVEAITWTAANVIHRLVEILDNVDYAGKEFKRLANQTSEELQVKINTPRNNVEHEIDIVVTN